MAAHRDALSRQELARLGREWLLHGHLQDRVGMPLVLERAGRDAMQQAAIEEWMAASPVYSRRMQRLLGFEGTGVDTIFKNIQLDIGAPHQFLDFRFRLDSPDHGEFWLAHCGALMDVEPLGEDFVHGMCHAIEDPTFDATAGATNPKAQVRPVHRPPRVPADRQPHCRWRVDIVADAAAVQPTDLQHVVAASALAQLPPVDYPDDGTGGWPDYSGPFDPDFQLEDLSRAALLRVLDEVAVQSHLLLRAYLLVVRRRFGDTVADALLPRVVAGWGGLTAQRLRARYGLSEDLDGVGMLLGLHPMLFPLNYTGFGLDGPRLVLGAPLDPDGCTWLGMPRLLEPALQAAFPSLRLSDELVVSLGHEPVAVAPEVGLARISTGATFEFTPRRPLRLSVG